MSPNVGLMLVAIKNMSHIMQHVPFECSLTVICDLGLMMKQTRKFSARRHSSPFLLGTFRMLTRQNHLGDKTRQRPNVSSTERHLTPISHRGKLPDIFLQFLAVFCSRNGAHHEVQDSGDVHGDRLLCVLPVWLDPGVLHSAHRVLDLLRGGEHRANHLQLLL